MPKARKRKRILGAEELIKVWHAAIRQGHPHGTVCQLLMLTGQRVSEIANLQWRWINPREQTVTLPEWLTKNSKEHTFPYGDLVAEIVENIPRRNVTDWRHVPELFAAGASVFSSLKNICVWYKTNAGMGSLYRSQHEFVFVYKHGTARHINNVNLGKYGRNRTNVWTYVSQNALSGTAKSKLALHPTVKPVAMVADAIRDCSNPGNIILDPFGGAGTTMIAAEKTGRRARLLELSPIYVDVAIQRWQRLTGQTAYHAETGRPYGDGKATPSSK
jgi:hypothetical protein